MSRITVPSLENAPEASKPILNAVQKQLGSVPNLFRLAALSTAALTGLTGLNAALSKALDVKTRERIAIATAEVNGCDYCLSAHAWLGKNLAKLTPAEIELNRKGHSSDQKADAAVQFATRVAESRGKVSDAELAAVRLAGFTDAQIIEIVAVVAENVLTNFINNVARTDIDFPVLHSSKAA